jgi:hypothetical protein
MANPTGSKYLAANSGYTWVDGDIYQIPQTDQVEGAATGASFSGLGVENQPHQVLLNKIQLTHTKQLADEVNITNLLAFQALFTSAVGTSGWAKIGELDTSRGQIDLIVQWGTISLIGSNYSLLVSSTPLSFSFPIAFPSACWLLHPYWQLNASWNLSQVGNPFTIAAQTPLKTQNNKIVITAGAYPNPSAVTFAQTSTDGRGITGIGWWTLGY